MSSDNRTHFLSNFLRAKTQNKKANISEGSDLFALGGERGSASTLSLRWTCPSLLAHHLTSAPKEPNQNSFYATEKEGDSPTRGNVA